MPQVEGWRLESGEQRFSNDFFLTAGHVADTSVSARSPAQFRFFRGECGDREGNSLLSECSLALGPWASGFIPWCFG